MGDKSKSVIVRTPGTCGGRPRIEGTRISVPTVVEAYRAFLRELFAKDFLENHPQLRAIEVEAALNYYDNHREELAALLQRIEPLHTSTFSSPRSEDAASTASR